PGRTGRSAGPAPCRQNVPCARSCGRLAGGISPCGQSGEVTKSLGSTPSVRAARVDQERDTPMRRSFKRFAPAGLLAGLVAALVAVGGHHLQGQPKVVPPGKDDAKKDGKAKSSFEGQPFEFPEERDAKNQLDSAREYLRAGNV